VDLQQRITAFARLGEYLRGFDKNKKFSVTNITSPAFQNLKNEVDSARLRNSWFVQENVENMLFSLGKSLELSKLEQWTSKYDLDKYDKHHVKTIAVIMAGNVPAVGFHDFLSVLISGNGILAKLSSDDDKLIPAIADLLLEIEAGFKGFIKFEKQKITGFDAVIATGSGNTARYFDYYFGKYPNIIRRNRNGIAVLNTTETKNDFEKLANDVFMYFGLGCRNVSKLFVPEGYDFTPMLDVFSKRIEIKNHSKYFNNYEYNKAIYLVNSRPHLDAGNLLLVEDESYASPVSVLYYEHYNDIMQLNKKILLDSQSIQCIVSNDKGVKSSFDFGQSQEPELWDYADGVDTLGFLLGID